MFRKESQNVINLKCYQEVISVHETSDLFIIKKMQRNIEEGESHGYEN